VFGEAKEQVLRRASLYLQQSRFDGFSLSVAGAMLQGLPCAVVEDQAIAEEIRLNDLGLVLPTDVPRAAEEIRRALDDPQQLRRWSVNASPYARNRFDPVRSAEAHLAFYAEVLAHRRAR
jgi:glycosyltransferase involved in cell wall biosynthesis